MHSCTIITCPPNELMKPIHDRMPVILSREAANLWLDPEVHDLDQLMPLLKPYADEAMETSEVSTLVNSVKNDTAEVIASLR